MSHFSGADHYRALGRGALGALALVALAMAAYRPALDCGFIWDDDDYVENNRNIETDTGLRDIWLKPLSIPQYYPLVHTTYWFEYQLFRRNPRVFHFDNALL